MCHKNIYTIITIIVKKDDNTHELSSEKLNTEDKLKSVELLFLYFLPWFPVPVLYGLYSSWTFYIYNYEKKKNYFVHFPNRFFVTYSNSSDNCYNF